MTAFKDFFLIIYVAVMYWYKKIDISHFCEGVYTGIWVHFGLLRKPYNCSHNNVKKIENLLEDKILLIFPDYEAHKNSRHFSSRREHQGNFT